MSLAHVRHYLINRSVLSGKQPWYPTVLVPHVSVPSHETERRRVPAQGGPFAQDWAKETDHKHRITHTLVFAFFGALGESTASCLTRLLVVWPCLTCVVWLACWCCCHSGVTPEKESSSAVCRVFQSVSLMAKTLMANQWCPQHF